MAAGLQPDRAVIVEPEPDGVSALGEIEGFDRMTGCGPTAEVSRTGAIDPSETAGLLRRNRSDWRERPFTGSLGRWPRH